LAADKINIAIAGIGGFGRVHVRWVQSLCERGLASCVAFCETNPDRSRDLAGRLMAAGAAHYDDYSRMLRERTNIDLVVISTPIHLHKPMCIEALRSGCHVLLEKPPAVTVQDIAEMLAAQRSTGLTVQVNFQNTSGQAFRLMLQKLREQAIGKVRSVTGIGKWKRLQAYYERTPWAGRLTHDGRLVLDGTLSNPFSHLLNNCLIAAFAGEEETSLPTRVQAELYHAYDIEGDDTSCVRIDTPHGVSIRFYSTLCHGESTEPVIRVEAERGEMVWGYRNRLTITEADGRQTDYTFGEEQGVEAMYLNCFAAIRERRTELFSPLSSTYRFVASLNAALESSGPPRAIPFEYIRRQREQQSELRTIDNISAAIDEAALSGKLFSELPAPWAAPSRPFDLHGYERFQPAWLAGSGGIGNNAGAMR